MNLKKSGCEIYVAFILAITSGSIFSNIGKYFIKNEDIK